MKFYDNFKNTCKFSAPNFEDLDDFNREIFQGIEAFNEAYEIFKQEHGLQNLYFSEVVHVECKNHMITEVYYAMSDLYLTYLKANSLLPEGVLIETYLIREQYFYNTPKEWSFRDSMFEALENQEKYLKKESHTTYRSSSFEGVTERIRLSNPSNGLPGMIIERIPMTYEDLVDKSSA